ncbi:MAG: hypothetical protein WCO92_05995, partial [Verrucomicrobiota bacterium]
KEAKQCSLKLLLCEHEILNALLTEPVPLERAQAYSRIRSIHALSKDAFENARRLLELKSQHDISIDEYIRTETEYSQAKKTYYSKVEEVKRFYSLYLNPNALKDIIPPLYNLGIAKKRVFKVCEANLKFRYGSLEQATLLQQQCFLAGNAMAKSGSFFQKKATTLEHLLTQHLEQEESNCYHDQAATLDLLAQDHLSLARAITEDNTVATEHLKKRISFALHAKLVFERQLSIFQQIKQAALPSYIADNYRKSFHLLQEAGQCFLSAYRHLKDQDLSLPSQDAHDRGLNLMNTALVFQLPLIPDEQRAHYQSDYLATIEAAQHHAELVIQTAPHEETRLYHEKIAGFLYTRISALTHFFEILSFKKTILPNSPSSYFLEQTASLFLESSNRFQQLCQLSSSQLDLPETKLLIEAAAEKKTRADKMLLQTKAMLSPQVAASTSNQNQDLHSWSD